MCLVGALTRLLPRRSMASMSSSSVNGRATANARCQVGGLFARCSAVASHVCQYCARRFCDAHTYHLADHEAVCARRECREKWDDLQRHLGYRAFVAQRNRVGVCGVAGCEGRWGYACSLCQGQFCPEHLEERLYPVFDGYHRREESKSVCAHCWERRKIWARR